MIKNFDRSLSYLLECEGGFVCHPADPGGMTNLGVTKKTWEDWVGHEVTERTMRSLTSADVMPLYKRKYWDAVKANDLPSGIDYIVFDTAVNSGPGRAIKFLQGCVGVDVDGSLGPVSMKAINACNPSVVIEDYVLRRLSYLHDLPTWDTFGRGWNNRVQKVRLNALKMIQ
jgi:lysozyme family protein